MKASARQHCAGFSQKDAARLGEPYGFGGALQQGEAEFLLQIANLPAHRRPRDAQIRGENAFRAWQCKEHGISTKADAWRKLRP